MQKARLSIVLICLFLGNSCALHNAVFNRFDKDDSSSKTNFIKVARVGIKVNNRHGELYVVDLTPNSPAANSGIKIGDTILSLDGNKILSMTEMRAVLNNKAIGEHALFLVKRNGQNLSFDIEPKFLKIKPTLIKLDSLLVENKKIVIAIIVTEVKNATLNKSSGNYESWVDSIKSSMQSRLESNLLNAYDNEKSFSIVDRNRLHQILEEHRLSQSGLISDKLRTQIGIMTGATHLLDATLSRFSLENGFEDVESERLIDIETGNVLAVDTESMKN